MDVGISTGSRPDIIRVEQQHLIGISAKILSAVPNVGDDHPAVGGGEIQPDRAGGRVSGVESDLDAQPGKLPRRGIGPLACRHGHDLHAHDHEAVIEDRAHDDQEEGQNDGELHEGLALALAPRDPKGRNIRGYSHWMAGLMVS